MDPDPTVSGNINGYSNNNNNVWTWIGNTFLRTWWFEPALATACFTVFVSWYWHHERCIYKISRTPTWTYTKTTATTNGTSLHHWTFSGHIIESAIAYWIGIYLWTRIVPPAAPHIPDGIPQNARQLMYLVIEVASGIGLYDFVFYFIHWAMHEIPIVRHIHIRHHELHKVCRQVTTGCGQQQQCAVAVVESRDTLRHSLLDGSLQVLVNILVQRYTIWGCVKTRFARAIHNIVVIWMLTESHCAAPTPYIWRKYCIGVRYHYVHHVLSPTHQPYMRYQPFFGYMDDLRLWIRSTWSSS